MLPGFHGHLISEAFLETLVAAGASPAMERHERSRWLEWRDWCLALGPAASVRAVFEIAAVPLAGLLGFDAPAAVRRTGGVTTATLRTPTHVVALVVPNWSDALEAWWTTAIAESVARGSPWCVLFNGLELRVIDAARSHGRRHVEFDVETVLDDERAFAACRHVVGASQLAGGPEPPRTRLHDLVAASDAHAAAVCRSLRSGVLEASGAIATALVGRTRRRPDEPAVTRAFEQSLTIVYRLLFLLFAEARGLVPLWHRVYRSSYSVEALRTMAERPQGAVGFWDTLQAIARLAHAGCRAGDLRVTPFNGRLFAPSRAPLAERRGLDDDAARRAVLAISTRPSVRGGGLDRIGYRDLGVEQLGAVYETLLDYQPVVDGRRVRLDAGSGVRKATGTFYTPQPIADYLVRRALGPLVREAAPERILHLRVLDPAMGSGAFLVAACRYLAREYERALIASGGCAAADLGDAERAAIRRTIAERCLYGVDVNPMAVQLARLSMWLTTLSADRPLTFLDHRLRTGDSLVGAWIATLGRAPAPVPRRREDSRSPALFEDARVRSALDAALPVRFALEDVPGDSIERIREKEQALAALRRRGHAWDTWRRVADLWCAAWFTTKDVPVPAEAFGALTDALLTGRGSLPDAAAHAYLTNAAAIAARRRFFHWEIEYPEAFFGQGGARLPAPGFDAVIGNPPWDMVRADSGGADERARARPDSSALVRFARSSGLYDAAVDGHANRYQLFLERALDLTKPGGRVGLVLPGGLALDHGSARLRRRLFTRADVDAIVGLDNRDGVFPIHKSVRFVLVTASVGGATRAIACRLGERDPAALERLDDPADPVAFPVRLPLALLERLSGEGMAVPDLRSATDVAIAERSAALFPRLDDAAGWGARFGRELNATDDRPAFSPAGEGLPIVEGKQIAPFAVDLSRSSHAITAAAAARRLPARPFARARIGYRDVASATNRLTLIAAILPAGCVTTHTIFCLRPPLSLSRQHALCGLLNSFVVNYLARQRVATHVTTAIVQALPAPPPSTEPRALGRIGALARLLSRGPDEEAYCRLQIEVAKLYRLSVGEFEHVLGTFPLIEARIRERALQLFAGRHGDE